MRIKVGAACLRQQQREKKTEERARQAHCRCRFLTRMGSVPAPPMTNISLDLHGSLIPPPHPIPPPFPLLPPAAPLLPPFPGDNLLSSEPCCWTACCSIPPFPGGRGLTLLLLPPMVLPLSTSPPIVWLLTSLLSTASRPDVGPEPAPAAFSEEPWWSCCCAGSTVRRPRTRVAVWPRRDVGQTPAWTWSRHSLSTYVCECTTHAKKQIRAETASTVFAFSLNTVVSSFSRNHGAGYVDTAPYVTRASNPPDDKYLRGEAAASWLREDTEVEGGCFP